MIDINTIDLGDNSITYNIIRTNRKTVGISVKPNGLVIVRVPYQLDLDKINTIIYKKRQWITKVIEKNKQVILPDPLKDEIISGNTFLLKNKLITLKIYPIEQKYPKISFSSRVLNIYINKNLSKKERFEKIKQILVKWYKKKALNVIKNRIGKYLKYLDDKPKEIKVRDYKIRWGTCTSDKRLIFNWRIIMAPVDVIDYVIVHELAHIEVPNHSTKFWNKVESLFPDYKKMKEWLKFNGLTLDLRIQ
ncbi:MAG: M48 family metallopeptidase [Candidatus Lokiarchaeota archaeon]|nr:M48 family metallopeptidase [Candidatus Lokiarchaeota archaeon]